MRWEDIEIQQRRLAELGRRKLGGPGVLLVGTIRVDGSPKAEVGRFHLFRVEVEDLTFIRWGSRNDQYVTRWPSAVEFVRRGTSPTSLRPAEPIRELLS